jgi:hypothetical protein
MEENGKRVNMGDLWVAGAIKVITGLEPEMVNAGGKVLFSFPRTDEVLDAMDAYNSGATVSARDYSVAVRMLKGKMFASLGGYRTLTPAAGDRAERRAR